MPSEHEPVPLTPVSPSLRTARLAQLPEHSDSHSEDRKSRKKTNREERTGEEGDEAADRRVGSVHIKLICLLLMMQSAVIILTGRGLAGILQGISGFIFAVEGAWGAVKQDQKTLKVFMLFLGFYFVFSLFIGVINIQTAKVYCTTAQEEEMKKCLHRANIHGLLNIIFGITVIPFSVMVGLFYQQIEKKQASKHKAVAETHHRSPGEGEGYHDREEHEEQEEQEHEDTLLINTTRDSL